MNNNIDFTESDSAELEEHILPNSPTHDQEPQVQQLNQVVSQREDDDEEVHKLLVPSSHDLPLSPPSSVQTNFISYFAADFMKPGHDQYVYRHANGLCVIGLAPTHVAFKDEGGITAVDFNVGKSDRSGMKVTGKRKKVAFLYSSLENSSSFLDKCCVKGSLLEVNDRLIKQPGLLNSSADREGYIAILMPKLADWLKIKDSLLSIEDYKKLREGR
ncbi:hypothetical protein Tsubulata_021157 [Turnera subulata]|uniref:Protein Abitram n=1 Tax=Turnera subulata TaxID=218843 RepID=A0A9Q0JL44_9ROSI|nr:hypothetical protein Tsubulata_021157 [Turnera subulata]